MSCRVLVRDVMSRPPVALSPGSSLLEAVRVMAAYRVGSVVIVEGERPIGIVTERDVIRLVGEMGREALELPLGRVMTRDLLVVDADDCIVEALHLMVEWRVRHAPVVGGGGGMRLLGVITLRDIAYRIVEEPDLLMDIVSMRAPEVSKDLVYLLIRGLQPG